MESTSELKWFAAYTRNNFARRIKSRLTEVGVECYLPMRLQERIYNGRKRRIEMPLIPNVIFVRIDAERCYDIVNELSLPMRYVLDHAERRPAPISDKQMNDFRFLIEMPDDCLTLVDIPLAAGDRVRVTAGPMKGIEGELIRIKGHRRVVVRLNDTISVASTYIPATMLERINE